MKQNIIYFTFAFLSFSSCEYSKKETNSQSKNIDTIEIQKQIEVAETDSPKMEDYQIETTNDETAKKIINFLLDKNKNEVEKNILTSDDRKFSFYEIDLNDDHKNEYLIYLQGRYFCGSGGCSFYLLNNDFSINTYFSVTFPPIFRSSSKTDGWHDLILFGDYNQDGGIKNYIYLKYDKLKGKYPSNPSLIEKVDMAPSGHDFVMWHDEFSKAKPYAF